MAEREKDTLTKLELQIMQVIWKQGASNVGAVQAGLEQQLAYTTGTILAVVLSQTALATCTGANPCNACKNCKYCKHCAKEGGTCGVCKPSA